MVGEMTNGGRIRQAFPGTKDLTSTEGSEYGPVEFTREDVDALLHERIKLPHHRSPSSFPSSSSSPSPDRAAHRSPAVTGDGKLRLDLACDGKPKVSTLGNEGDDAVAAAARPWNLRTRRTACNEPGDEPTRITESSSLRRHEIGVRRGSNEGGDGDGEQSKLCWRPSSDSKTLKGRKFEP